MEAETDAGFIQREVAKISIHSARVGGDFAYVAFLLLLNHFNPLRPCGRRQSITTKPITPSRFQSTPPVWAETLRLLLDEGHDVISIHSARVGGDVDYDAVEGTEYISIHSARVGGDTMGKPILTNVQDFNPLRPCGRRRHI